MDPLSVAASVVGLLAAGGKVASLLFTVVGKCQDSSSMARSILSEVTDITAALGQLQDFLNNRIRADSERGNLIKLDQLLTTLTGCVTTYSDLQFILTGLNIGEDMGAFDRIQWLRQEDRLNTLVQRLQSHKSSLTLMLTIIQCNTLEEAQSCTQKLCILVEQVLQSNRDLSERIRGLEREGSIITKARSSTIAGDDASTIRQSGLERASMIETSSHPRTRFAFEDDLESSRVYNKAIYRYSQVSITSTALHTTALSIFSKLSLSQVSSISFYALPLCASDLCNSEEYIFGEEGATFMNPRATPPVPPTPPKQQSVRPEQQVTGSSVDHEPATAADTRAQDASPVPWSAPRKRNGLLGRFAIPQRRVQVSEPNTPWHITHVEFDDNTGQFTGLPKEWRRIIDEANGRS